MTPRLLLKDEEKIEEIKGILKKNNMSIAAISAHGNPVHPNAEIAKDFHDDFEAANATNAYLEKLDRDASIMDTIGSKTQSYAPEIVFTCRYDADENGDAHTMELLPDGYACYVSHKPAELPYGVRWIARTEDEDALGMVLPATAQHMGYLYCKKNGQEKYLASGESLTWHITTGILSPEASDAMKDKIVSLK